MQTLWEKVCELATQPNALLVASLFANAVLAVALVALWRQYLRLHREVWDVIKMALPLAMRRPA